MNKLQKWWKPALAIVSTVIALQVAVSLLVRTHRGHAYLVAHLERAFGRQVEVEGFDARILPSPQLDANGVTVGEDPTFSHEYFLRAENLRDRKSTRLNSSHITISYAVFCLKKKNKK